MHSARRLLTVLLLAAGAPLVACSASPTESASTDGESALEGSRVGSWGITLQLCKTTPTPGSWGQCPAGQSIAGDTIPVVGPGGRGRTYFLGAVSKPLGLSWNRRYVKTIRVEGNGVHFESRGQVGGVSPFTWAFDDALPAGSYEVSVVSALRSDASRPGDTEGFDREDAFTVNVQGASSQGSASCLPAFNQYCTGPGLFCAAPPPNTLLVAPDTILAGNVPLVRCRSAGCAVSATACPVESGLSDAQCFFSAPGTNDACYPVRPAKCPGCG
jgi:hypothetical protein